MWAPLMAHLEGRALHAVDLPAYGLTDDLRGSRWTCGRTLSASSMGARRTRTRASRVHRELPRVAVGAVAGDGSPTTRRRDGDVGCPALAPRTSAPLPMRMLSTRASARCSCGFGRPLSSRSNSSRRWSASTRSHPKSPRSSSPPSGCRDSQPDLPIEPDAPRPSPRTQAAERAHRGPALGGRPALSAGLRAPGPDGFRAGWTADGEALPAPSSTSPRAVTAPGSTSRSESPGGSEVPGANQLDLAEPRRQGLRAGAHQGCSSYAGHHAEGTLFRWPPVTPASRERSSRPAVSVASQRLRAASTAEGSFHVSSGWTIHTFGS